MTALVVRRTAGVAADRLLSHGVLPAGAAIFDISALNANALLCDSSATPVNAARPFPQHAARNPSPAVEANMSHDGDAVRQTPLRLFGDDRAKKTKISD
jgi:hypothetical protein